MIGGSGGGGGRAGGANTANPAHGASVVLAVPAALLGHFFGSIFWFVLHGQSYVGLYITGHRFFLSLLK